MPISVNQSFMCLWYKHKNAYDEQNPPDTRSAYGGPCQDIKHVATTKMLNDKTNKNISVPKNMEQTTPNLASGRNTLSVLFRNGKKSKTVMSIIDYSSMSPREIEMRGCRGLINVCAKECLRIDVNERYTLRNAWLRETRNLLTCCS